MNIVRGLHLAESKKIHKNVWKNLIYILKYIHTHACAISWDTMAAVMKKSMNLMTPRLEEQIFDPLVLPTKDLLPDMRS